MRPEYQVNWLGFVAPDGPTRTSAWNWQFFVVLTATEMVPDFAMV
jgi:hypothetical protein